MQASQTMISSQPSGPTEKSKGRPKTSLWKGIPVKYHSFLRALQSDLNSVILPLFGQAEHVYSILKRYGWIGYGAVPEDYFMDTYILDFVPEHCFHMDAHHSEYTCGMVTTALSNLECSMCQTSDPTGEQFRNELKHTVQALRLLDRYRLYTRLLQLRTQQSTFSALLHQLGTMHWSLEGGCAIWDGHQGVHSVPEMLQPLALSVMTPGPHTSLGMMVECSRAMDWEAAVERANAYNLFVSRHMHSSYRGPTIGFTSCKAGRTRRRRCGVMAVYPVDCACANDVRVDMSPFQSRPDPVSLATMFMKNIVPWMRMLEEHTDDTVLLAVVGYMWYDDLYPCFGVMETTELQAMVHKTVWENVMASIVAGSLFSTLCPLPDINMYIRATFSADDSRDIPSGLFSPWTQAMQWLHASTRETMMRPLCVFAETMREDSIASRLMHSMSLEDATILVEQYAKESGLKCIASDVLIHFIPVVQVAFNFSRDIRRLLSKRMCGVDFMRKYRRGMHVVTMDYDLYPVEMQGVTFRMHTLNYAWAQVWKDARAMHEYVPVSEKYTVPTSETEEPALRMLQAHRNSDVMLSHEASRGVQQWMKYLTTGGVMLNEMTSLTRPERLPVFRIRDQELQRGMSVDMESTNAADYALVQQLKTLNYRKKTFMHGYMSKRGTKLNNINETLFYLQKTSDPEERYLMSDTVDWGTYWNNLFRMIRSVVAVDTEACSTSNVGLVASDSSYWSSVESYRSMDTNRPLEMMTFMTHMNMAIHHGKMTSVHPLLLGRVPHWLEELGLWTQALGTIGEDIVPRLDQGILTPTAIHEGFKDCMQPWSRDTDDWIDVSLWVDTASRSLQYSPLLVRTKTYGGLLNAPMNAAASEMDERARLYLISQLIKYSPTQKRANYHKLTCSAGESFEGTTDICLQRVLDVQRGMGILNQRHNRRRGKNFIASTLNTWQMSIRKLSLQWSITDIPVWMARTEHTPFAPRSQQIQLALTQSGPTMIKLVVELKSQHVLPVFIVLTALMEYTGYNCHEYLYYVGWDSTNETEELIQSSIGVGKTLILNEEILEATSDTVRSLFRDLFPKSGTRGKMILESVGEDVKDVEENDDGGMNSFSGRVQTCFNLCLMFFNPRRARNLSLPQIARGVVCLFRELTKPHIDEEIDWTHVL